MPYCSRVQFLTKTTEHISTNTKPTQIHIVTRILSTLRSKIRSVFFSRHKLFLLNAQSLSMSTLLQEQVEQLIAPWSPPDLAGLSRTRHSTLLSISVTAPVVWVKPWATATSLVSQKGVPRHGTNPLQTQCTGRQDACSTACRTSFLRTLRSPRD